MCTGGDLRESGIIEMMDTGILDLDRENDFELMQVVAKYMLDKNSTFGIKFIQ